MIDKRTIDTMYVSFIDQIADSSAIYAEAMKKYDWNDR